MEKLKVEEIRSLDQIIEYIISASNGEIIPNKPNQVTKKTKGNEAMITFYYDEYAVVYFITDDKVTSYNTLLIKHFAT
mgnify:CR=1 FL=1